jgi:hypothetical protein
MTAEPIPVPSGQMVTLQDVVLNIPGPAGLTARFRFVAPGIADGTVDFDTAVADMQALCDGYALPRAITGTGPAPQQIIISLAAVPTVFGEPAPDVVQYFEAYRIEDGACIWEVF